MTTAVEIVTTQDFGDFNGKFDVVVDNDGNEGQQQHQYEKQLNIVNNNSCNVVNSELRTPTEVHKTAPATMAYTDLAPTQNVLNIQNEQVAAEADLEEEQAEHLQQQLVVSHKEMVNIYNDDASQQDFDELAHPLSERWSPLGANYDDAVSANSELLSPESELELLSSDSQEKHELLHGTDNAELARLRNMEEEQELLTTSLLALTSHFAHVQLRVRQIVEAPTYERDQLLRDLEEFAFRGIPEPMSQATVTTAPKRSGSMSLPIDAEAAQQRQFELIEQLKSQLSDLEKLAYESGAPVLPQHMLLEKQKIIIDELKNKLNLKVEEQEMPELSTEELKSRMDNAIGEFVGPLKMKEQLVAQLKTQIADLERFIAFLQCDSDDTNAKTLNGGNDKLHEAYNSYAAKKKAKRTTLVAAKDADAVSTLQTSSAACAVEAQQTGVRESLNSKAHGLMDKASLLMQMFATTHFGTKAEQFQKNTLKKTHKGNHWGDLRAQLEVDIQEVASLAATLSFDREKLATMRRALKCKMAAKAVSTHNGTLTTLPAARNATRYTRQRNELKTYVLSSDSDDDVYDCYNWEKHSRRVLAKGGDSIATISKELTSAVRKNFAITLQRLIQHGLRVETESATSSLIVPFMRCLNPSPVFAAEHGSYRAATTSFVASTSSATAAAINSYDDDYVDDNAGGFNLFGGGGGSRQMHAWELILEYYYLKHGDEYNNTPARKLSQSFNLDIVDAHAVTAKQNLLSTIGMIIAMHRPYKRSYNAHFKAFVSAALNAHQLVEWLNLIFSCNDLIDTYYTPNSYVVRTGFRDSLRSIDVLSKYDFDLPVDLAVRHFRNL